MKQIFVKEFRLGKEFDYSKYMRKKLLNKLAHSLHIHSWAWGIVVIFCLLVIFIRSIIEYFTNDEATFDSMKASMKATVRACLSIFRV